MDFPIHIDTMRMGLFSVHLKGSQVEVSTAGFMIIIGDEYFKK